MGLTARVGSNPSPGATLQRHKSISCWPTLTLFRHLISLLVSTCFFLAVESLVVGV